MYIGLIFTLGARGPLARGHIFVFPKEFYFFEVQKNIYGGQKLFYVTKKKFWQGTRNMLSRPYMYLNSFLTNKKKNHLYHLTIIPNLYLFLNYCFCAKSSN